MIYSRNIVLKYKIVKCNMYRFLAVRDYWDLVENIDITYLPSTSLDLHFSIILSKIYISVTLCDIGCHPRL